mmetsp:Transcript_5958/g.14072  ORF Transcript_5958/g.14072 Transcript_5958/m.14072 type:complete len:640 (-) Transcript_5958:467-2386(-)
MRSLLKHSLCSMPNVLPPCKPQPQHATCLLPRLLSNAKSDSTNSEATTLNEAVLLEGSSSPQANLQLSSVPPPAVPGRRGKSQKRRAAEALLSGRYCRASPQSESSDSLLTPHTIPHAALQAPIPLHGTAAEALLPPQGSHSLSSSLLNQQPTSSGPQQHHHHYHYPCFSFAAAGLHTQAEHTTTGSISSTNHHHHALQPLQPPLQQHAHHMQLPRPSPTTCLHHAQPLAQKRTHASLAPPDLPGAGPSGQQQAGGNPTKRQCIDVSQQQQQQQQQERPGIAQPGLGAPSAPASAPSATATSTSHLAAAAAGAHGAATAATTAAVPQGRHVAACPPSCSTSDTWCSFDVRIPHVDWHRVFQDSPSTYSYSILSKGYDKYYLGNGLEVYMVDNPAHAADAINRLRASMQDPLITIDLEWKPEWKAGQNNRVSLMQLSSATVCVLLHTSSMGFQLPQAVKDLLTDPKVRILGFGWESADENKMQSTFQMGQSSFGNFLDLQVVAKQLSFPGSMGLLKLTKLVLGHDLVKAKAVSRSNWSLRFLSLHQIKYAAMDVFACGQVFRALRLWHSSPSACPGCHALVGALLPPPILQCPSTKKSFGTNMRHYLENAAKLKVPALYIHCEACGRFVPNNNAKNEGKK